MPEAKAYDLASPLGSEFERRMRTLAGLWQNLVRRPELLGFRDRMWLHFVSHKVGRLLLPWLALAALGSAFWLDFAVAGSGAGVGGGFFCAGGLRFAASAGVGTEANHLAGADHLGDAGSFLLLDFGVSSAAPALVEAHKSGSGEAGRLVRLLLAPKLLNGRDVLEGQPVVNTNTQALAIAQAFPRSPLVPSRWSDWSGVRPERLRGWAAPPSVSSSSAQSGPTETKCRFSPHSRVGLNPVMLRRRHRSLPPIIPSGPILYPADRRRAPGFLRIRLLGTRLRV